MKQPIPYTPFIASPRVLASDIPPPTPIATLTIGELCALAGVADRVTSPHSPLVFVHPGRDHFRTRAGCYVGLGRRRFSRRGREDALRVLEILAHGFHDYAARENLRDRGLFVPPRRRGRPALTGRKMTAAERMRRMRRRTRHSARRETNSFEYEHG